MSDTTITFKGDEVKVSGTFPQTGQAAPDFSLVDTNLAEISLGDFSGKKVVLNIFPSVDTSVCALQTKTFSEKLAGRDDVVLVFTSRDLPFAFGRFCAAEGVENAVTASDFRYNSVAQAYGVEMLDGPLSGLYARAVVVIDEEQNVVYSELVPEIASEPNYEAAVAATLISNHQARGRVCGFRSQVLLPRLFCICRLNWSLYLSAQKFLQH